MPDLTPATAFWRFVRRPSFFRRASSRRGDRLHERVVARLRGQQTVADALAAGLNSSGKFFMGTGSYIDAGFAWAVTIEDRVLIAPDVTILAHDAAAKRLADYTKVRPVVIRESAYLGAGSIILPGVTVGARAVVGAGAIVTHDVEPDTVVVGAPARPVMKTDELIERLEHERERYPIFDYVPIEAENADEAARQRIAMQAALAEHGTIYVR